MKISLFSSFTRCYHHRGLGNLRNSTVNQLSISRAKSPLGARIAEAKVDSKQDKYSLAVDASLPVALNNPAHRLEVGDILYINPAIKRLYEPFFNPLLSQKAVPDYLLASSDRNAVCLVNEPSIDSLRKADRGGDQNQWDSIRLK